MPRRRADDQLRLTRQRRRHGSRHHPHCGAALPLLAARIELFRSLLPGRDGEPPDTLTTQTQLRRFWYDLAGQPLPIHARVLLDTVGDDRVLYGSDFCWTPAAGVMHQVAALDADTGTDWRTLTHANVHRFLQRGSAR